MARPREAVGCRMLICRKADSGQLNDLATRRPDGSGRVGRQCGRKPRRKRLLPTTVDKRYLPQDALVRPNPGWMPEFCPEQSF